MRGYNPTEPDTVLPALADISAYLYNSEDDLLIQAALVHYQFEMIHPFEKYNGVVGRILLFMVLRKIVGKALPVLCLSEHLLLNKNEYFDMLRTTQYSGGYVRWIKFFIQIINEAARNSVALLKKYEETIKLDEERLRNAMPQTRTLWSVYEYIKAFPVTSILLWHNILAYRIILFLKQFLPCKRTILLCKHSYRTKEGDTIAKVKSPSLRWIRSGKL